MISIGSRIYAEDSPQYALCGPAVRDHKGNLLILTARALLSMGGRFCDGSGTEIGRRPSSYFHPNTVASGSAEQLVGWFSPETGVVAKGNPSRALDSSKVILATEVVVSAARVQRSAYICGVNCFARFSLPEAENSLLIDGLIRVTSSDQTIPLAFPGAAGAVVRTAGQLVVGLVVGAVEGDLLIAPLDRVLAAEGLELASPKDLEGHNQSIVSRQTLWAFNTGRQSETVIRMAAALGLKSDPSAHVRDIIAAWTSMSWHLHRESDPRAFAPFQSTFAGINRDPALFAERMWEFGRDTLSGALPDGSNWEDIVAYAYASVDLDIGTRPDVERPVRSLASSYDVVARSELYEDA
jgi:hypothetical protein